MATPPGVSAAQFSAVLKEFAGVVGQEWVFFSDDDVRLYRDAYSPLRGQSEDRQASAAVAPASAEEVQAVVRIANKRRIPLYAISTGKNLGYGGSAPTQSGSVVLDLKRMNRIIEVSESGLYAIVEPGVSYFDLYNYIRDNDLNLLLDVPDPGWGSVLGNALDHGVGYTTARFRNHFDTHCGMEVVLANGEIVRTGMGALPNAGTWATYKNGFGPIVDGLFSQSNFGIVTKMGMWLQPKPEAYMSATIYAPRYDDLHAIVETLRYAESTGLAPGAPVIGSPLLVLPTNSRELVDSFYGAPPELPKEQQDLLAGAKLGYSDELQRYGLDNKIPYWSLNLMFYGPRKVIEAQWGAVQEFAARSIKGSSFKAEPVIGRADFVNAGEEGRIYAEHVGIPNLEWFAMGTRANGNSQPTSGHLWFAPVIPQTAEAILEANRVFEDASRTLPALKDMPLWGLKPFALPSPFYERNFLFILGFPVTEDHAFNSRVIEAFRALIQVGVEHGWGEYRTHPIFQDQIMNAMSWNDNALLRLHETVKDALDPNGILSPGRYGIWPRRLRK